MIHLPCQTSYPFEENYSDIIDVRSEREFAEDHIPQAINLPVLNDQEREKVGIIYKQVSPFEARKLGSALVAKNISIHLENYFIDKNKNYKPLIYCWRGGQRSQSLALILSQIGWRVTILEGGYKTYRNYVRERLKSFPFNFNYYVLGGLTGTGKTQILEQLETQGKQILNLEKLANHRGSLLGQEWRETFEKQPSQKQFESLLLHQFQQFNPHQPIWVESESHKIGKLHLPGVLWQKLKASPVIAVTLPLEERVKGLIQDYAHLIEHPQWLKRKLSYLKSRYGNAKIQQWLDFIEQEKWIALVTDLLQFHYDPTYQRSLSKIYQNYQQVINLENLSATEIEKAVKILDQQITVNSPKIQSHV